MFVDASVMIAVIAGEDDADDFADALDLHTRHLCSAISVWEAVAGLCRSYNVEIFEARKRVQSFLENGGFEFVAISEPEYVIATEAFGRFGKGRHPAALNMGDCFAYACAKANQVKLLYKGEDFAKTDLA